MKLLVLKWISPSCSCSNLIFFLFFKPVLVSETVLCDTDPIYLSPASLCPACLHLGRALPQLPISVLFCLAFQMGFSSHSPLGVCLTTTSFCTCKGCVFALGQGRLVAGSSDKSQTLPTSDSVFEGKGGAGRNVPLPL